MKRYKDYMDGVEVSDTLHEKLKHLDEPKKQARPWVKWGTMAAVMALIVGVGAYGLNRGGWGVILDSPQPNAATVMPEIADAPALYPDSDIAIEDPNGPFVDPIPPGARTDGGYELRLGEGSDSMVAYFLLPYLEWADASALPQNSMDYVLAPPDAIRRDATWDDVRLFAGGEKNMAAHLLWDEGMNWSGTVWFAEDGTPCAASLYTGYVRWGYGFCLSLEVMQGGEVPSCVVLPDGYYETSQWQDVKITALKNGGYMVDDDGVKLTEKREVSFFCNGTGYKLTLWADDEQRANELCARFVRYAIDDGFRLDVLSTDGVLDCSYYSVGEPNWEDGETGEFVPDYDPAYEDGVPDEDSEATGFYCDCPDCINGIVHTHPYYPSASN